MHGCLCQHTIFFHISKLTDSILFTEVNRTKDKTHGHITTAVPRGDLAGRLRVCKTVFFIISLSHRVLGQTGVLPPAAQYTSGCSLVIAYFSQNGYLNSVFIYHSCLHSFCHRQVIEIFKKYFSF